MRFNGYRTSNINYFREHKYRNIKEVQKEISGVFEREHETGDQNDAPIEIILKKSINFLKNY